MTSSSIGESLHSQIMGLAALAHPSRYQLKRLKALIASCPDRSLLVEKACRNRLGGLHYRNLKAADAISFFPTREVDQLRHRYTQNARENLERLSNLSPLLKRLHEASVPVVLLKGIAMLAQVYGDIGLRMMSDVDLWVLEKDRDRCARIMDQFGYRQDPVYPTTYRKGATVIDLHTHPLGADRIPSRKYLLPGSVNTMFQRARVFTYGGTPVRCMDPCDQFLVLWKHAAKHSLEGLDWLADLLNLIVHWGASDWKALNRRSGSVQHEKDLYAVYFLLQRIFNYKTTSSDRILKSARRPSPIALYLLRKKAKGDLLPQWSPMVFFSPGGRFSVRVRYLFESLLPPPWVLRRGFYGGGQMTEGKLYLMRIGQLILRIVRPGS